MTGALSPPMTTDDFGLLVLLLLPGTLLSILFLTTFAFGG
jgi:hypothetical protein